VGEYTAENHARASGWVSANDDEIVRQASVMLRLIDSMGEGSEGAYIELLGRVAGRLSNCLGIFELYRRNDEADFKASCVEFDKAIGDREVLNVRRLVGDIGEEEFNLKMAVAEWSIGRHGSRKREIEGGVKELGGLRDQFDERFLDEITQISKSEYRKIRELGLDQTLTDVVIGSLGRLVDKLG